MKPRLDVRAVLERAGADPHAAEGRTDWALAQVDVAVIDLAATIKLLIAEGCTPANLLLAQTTLRDYALDGELVGLA